METPFSKFTVQELGSLSKRKYEALLDKVDFQLLREFAYGRDCPLRYCKDFNSESREHQKLVSDWVA